MKKLLPTSTAGSLPKPSWLAQPEQLWSPWKLQDQELIDGKQDALRLCLEDQQQAGIDIVSDGEQTRQHFVTTFIEHLNGVDFEKREIVKIRDRYEASVPTVVGPVSRQKSVFVEDAKFLRKQTDQPIKWALPGPMTIWLVMQTRAATAAIALPARKPTAASTVIVSACMEPGYRTMLRKPGLMWIHGRSTAGLTTL